MTKKPRTNAEVYQSVRREWDVNPITKVIPNKKKNKRIKHPKKEEEEE